MTDYAGEQAMEIEALEAILMDDLQIYDGTNPDGWSAVGETYKVVVDLKEDGEEAGPQDEEKVMEFLFAHTAEYPDSAPCIRLRSVRGLSDKDIADGMKTLEAEVQANLGMSMIFTLVTAAKEWLRTKTDAVDEVDPIVAAKKAAEEEEARRLAARAHGIPVTVETFTAWKLAFEAEMELAKAKAEELLKEDDKARRISGKAWFMREGPGADDGTTEAGALSEDDEEDFDFVEGQEDEEEEDIDYDDDDDEGMLNEILPEDEE